MAGGRPLLAVLVVDDAVLALGVGGAGCPFPLPATIAAAAALDEVLFVHVGDALARLPGAVRSGGGLVYLRGFFE